MYNSRSKAIGNSMSRRVLAAIVLIFWPLGMKGQVDPSNDFQRKVVDARQLEQKGDYAAAAEAYKQALQTHPEIAELWANLGVMQHELHDYTGAIVTFERARNLKPELLVPNLFLGIDYLKLEQPEKSISYLLAARRLAPSDLQVQLALARSEFASKRYPAAVKEYSVAIKEHADFSAAWFERGMSYLEWVETDADAISHNANESAYAKALFAESLAEQHRYAQSADVYRDVLLTSNRPPCIRGQLGFVYLVLGDLARAGAEFDAERKSEPACALADLGTVELNVRRGSMQDALNTFDRMWIRDAGYMLSNRELFIRTMTKQDLEAFTGAVRTAAEARKITQEALHFLLADSSADSGAYEHDAALTPMKANGKAIGNLSAATYSTANTLYSKQEYSECAETLSGKSNPTSSTATLSLLAACSYFAGKFDLTSKVGLLLDEREGFSAEALYWSVRSNQKLAFADLEHFEKLNPNSARTHILLGDAYRQSQNYDDAKAEYSKSLSISENDPAALIGLASTLLLASQADQAVDISTKALAYFPNDPEVNVLMGESLLAVRKFDEAESFLKKGLTAKPQMQPHVHALLGKVYAAQGHPREAVAELNLGVPSDEDGSIHYQLALQYRKLGDDKASRSAMKESEALKLARLQRAHIALEDPAIPFDN